MFDIATAQSLLPRELDAIIDRSTHLAEDQWAVPISLLPGWTVAALLDHVGRAANQQSEAFENMFAGSAEIPAYPNAEPRPPSDVIAQLKAGRDRFVNALQRLDEGHLATMTPLPFGLVPTAVAVQIAVLEYAYHRWDLEHALGNTSFQLPTDVAPHGFEFLGGLLPMLAAAGAQPDWPLAFQLQTASGSLVLDAGPDGWQVTPAPTTDTVCVIEGDVADVVLFGMGRVDSHHPKLHIGGCAAAEATAFKKYFPGP
jgi:uncharacterized protein (TIGR03083 family)